MSSRSRSRRRKKKSAIISSDYIYDFSCNPCSDEGKNNEAYHRCVECKQYYCRRCLDDHSKFERHHKILDASDTYTKHGGKRVEEHKEEEENETCEYHDGKVLDMYCRRHDEVCCDDCVSLSHRHCPRVESVKDVALHSQHMNNDIRYNLEEMVTDLREVKSKQHAFYEEVNLKRNQATTEIKTFKAELIRKVEELEKASIKEVDKRSEAITRGLDRDIERVNKALQELEKDQAKSKHQYGNETKRFVNLKQAQRHLSERKNITTEVCGKPLEKIINFSLHPEMEKYFKEYDHLGKTIVSRSTLVPFVNVVIPFATSASNKLKERLSSDLQKFGIRSKYVKASEIVDDVYTIVVISCMNDLRDLQVKRQQHRYIMILRLDETPVVERSLIEKIQDYMAVPLGEQFVSFVNWADVALKTSISYHTSINFYNGNVSFVFKESDINNALSNIAIITSE